MLHLSSLVSANLTIIGVRFELLLVPHTSGLIQFWIQCHISSHTVPILGSIESASTYYWQSVQSVRSLFIFYFPVSTMNINSHRSSSQFHHVTHTQLHCNLTTKVTEPSYLAYCSMVFLSHE